MSIIRGFIFLLFFQQQTFALRNPFSFGDSSQDQIFAHGVLHDLNVEFKVYCDKKKCVRVKTIENKSPST